MLNLVENNFAVTVIKNGAKKPASYFNKFDLVINDKVLSAVTSQHQINQVNPKKILNGRVVGSLKTYVGELYEKHFGHKLNIYFGEKYPKNIFVKQEFQTMGEYRKSDKPVWKAGYVNQINYWNETGIYGLYFLEGEFVYSYNYRNKNDYYVKLKNVKNTEYFTHEETEKLFGKDKKRLMAMARDCGMDYGRFDIIIDPKIGVVVVDINNAPFGNQVFDRKFIGTNIHAEAREQAKRILINKIKQCEELI